MALDPTQHQVLDRIEADRAARQAGGDRGGDIVELEHFQET